MSCVKLRCSVLLYELQKTLNCWNDTQQFHCMQALHTSLWGQHGRDLHRPAACQHMRLILPEACHESLLVARCPLHHLCKSQRLPGQAYCLG